MDFAGGSRSASADQDFLFFLADGRVRRRWSNVGLDGLDHDEEAAEQLAHGWYGTATRTETGMKEQWSNGGESVLQRTGSTLREGSALPYVRLPSCDGLLLDGTYRGGGEHMREHPVHDVIRFSRDGRFVEQKVCAAVMRHEGPAQGAGKYSIANYTLLLEYDHGPKVPIGFYVLGEATSKAPTIYLNTFLFSRVP